MKRKGKPMVTKLAVQGWCTDPFAMHEARWMSDGQPTKLVRDAGIETFDPPKGKPLFEPVPLVEGASNTPRTDARQMEEGAPSAQTVFDRLLGIAFGSG